MCTACTSVPQVGTSEISCRQFSEIQGRPSQTCSRSLRRIAVATLREIRTLLRSHDYFPDAITDWPQTRGRGVRPTPVR
jgi:hypothetical protein